ncbi:MAG: UDP-N-acetylmuramoyl-tripeptide--D-alanyl-D-alanine ligase [Polaromonas sp.]|uniref:UDP-N-acetylmuramoyl-tripeptide--D-alanyl-D- alanine ligase n=1 Tax=Polaromonas sp. TaxID=1869339 RepID=UPI0025D702A0|nr:UDP-N-acetylmuramoyl-tripeptide--D-alanyl-D-alanine ligase [Polaromonas sp.]MBI2725989.1 UDP-N-acetylmuramoyl-tripeptide--D-alanyl-D-alanine ligase [Polaromonas sp.]
MMTLQQALGWVGSGVLVGNPLLAVKRVHTDTRTLQEGDLFVALKGERFDANLFLSEARQQGATAAISHGGLAAAGLDGLEVMDSRLALGRLAAGWRAQFDLPLIAVTGSNGKTTVTQMIASILRAWKQGDAFSTEGNLNNDIGVPLTLLRLRQHHSAGVVELGMNHPGEIAYLAGIARPTVALVNNAQREHLEFMATVEAVARENGSVIASLGGEGTAVFPADDVYTPLWKSLAGSRKVLTFAEAAGTADVTGSARWSGNSWDVQAQTSRGPVDFTLRIAGRHNVKNALAATACALAAGCPLTNIAAGLSTFEPVKGRSRALVIQVGGRPLNLVDDTYNANPDSMRAAIDVLAELPGPRLLVMGDMGEVGNEGPAFHREAGGYARERGVDKLFALGVQSALAASSFGAGRHFADIESLNKAVLAELSGLGSVLVKGSRFMKMERAVQAMTDYTQKNPEGERHAA